MYKCEDCEAVFETCIEKRYRNSAGEELDPPTYHCPYCKSEFIFVAEQCEICTEYKDSCTVYDGVCDECLDKIEAKIKKIIHRNCTVLEVRAAEKHLDIGGIL